jgi:porin
MFPASNGRLRAGGLLALLLLIAFSVSGQDAGSWTTRETLTGDWGGLRTRWREAGFDVWASWGINLAGNPIGGLSHGIAYADDQTLGFDFNLQKLLGLAGSSVRLSFNNRDGENLSAESLGAIFAVQQLFGGGETARLMELGVEQALLGGRLNLRAGRILGSADFATSPLYCRFMNQALCGNLGNLGKNITFSFYPVASWGGRAQWTASELFFVQAGVFESNPTLTEKNGFDWSTQGATGAVTMVELWLTPGHEAGGLPGHYKLGGYYDSSSATDLYFDAEGGPAVSSGLPFLVHPGSSGLYLLFDQALWRPPHEGNRGLTVFGGLAFAAADVNVVPFFAFVGLLSTGPVSGRPDDTAGFSVAYGGVSNDLANTQRLAGEPPQSGETLFELNYTLQLTRWFSFEPNLQYVLRPGATGTIPNALVLGLQTNLTF